MGEEEIDKQIKELKEKKKSLKKKKINEKIEEKKDKKKNGNHVNELIRVSKNFDNHIIDVQNKRIEFGMDDNFVSKPKITELIINHKSWPIIKDDLINFNFGVDERINFEKEEKNEQ